MLTIDVEKTDDVAVVRCMGRIVRGAEVRTLRNAVVSEKNIRIVVLDLTDVETLDAGGLTALLSLQQWAQSRKVQLKLVNPSHFVNEILTRTGLNHVFDVSRFDHALFVLRAADARPLKYVACC
jgi:anti-anti-sigma factor